MQGCSQCKPLVVASISVNNGSELRQENTLNSHLERTHNPLSREDFSEYVAHLQLHMTLQARNLVPTLQQVTDSRELLLQQTQANFEKLVSRQAV